MSNDLFLFWSAELESASKKFCDDPVDVASGSLSCLDSISTIIVRALTLLMQDNTVKIIKNSSSSPFLG